MKKKSNILGNVLIIGIVLIVLLIASMISKNSGSGSVRVKEISFQEYSEKSQEDEFTVYLIGRNECSHCMEYKPLVNQVANKYNIDVYYINLDNVLYDEYVYLHDNISILKEQFSSDGDPIIPTPATVVYRNGHEIDSVLGNVKQEGFLDLIVRSGVVKK